MVALKVEKLVVLKVVLMADSTVKKTADLKDAEKVALWAEQSDAGTVGHWGEMWVAWWVKRSAI